MYGAPSYETVPDLAFEKVMMVMMEEMIMASSSMMMMVMMVVMVMMETVPDLAFEKELSYTGGRDKDRLFHGKGVVEFSDGGYMEVPIR